MGPWRRAAVNHVLLAGLILGPTAAAATQDTAAMAPVVLDGRVLLRVAASGNYSAAERAEEVSCRLADDLALPHPGGIEIAARDSMQTIRLRDQHLLTVTPADIIPGMRPEEQAQAWRRTITDALARARVERTLAYVGHAAGLCGIIVLAAIGIHWILRRAGRYARRRVPHQLAARSTTAESSPWHTALHLGSLACETALWVGVVAFITEQFPVTRQARYQIVCYIDHSLAAPIFVNNGSPFSALDALRLTGLVAALWLALDVGVRLAKARLSRLAGTSRSVLEPIGAVVQYGLLLLGLVIILQTAGLDVSSLAIPASVLGVGIGFGLQNIANNFLSGVIISFERPIQVGDYVHVGTLTGTVERIGARSTEIRTPDRVSIIVPNSRFLDTDVINWSHGDPLSQLHLPVSVAYGSAIQQVRTALLEAARAHPEVATDPQPDVRLVGFGDNGLEFELLVWTRDPRGQHLLRSDVNYRIESNLRRMHIEVPFPQRTLHIPASQVDAIVGAWARPPADSRVDLYDPNGIKVQLASDGTAPPTRHTVPPDTVIPPATIELDALVARMRGPHGLAVADRRHRLTTYAKCFVGSEAVEWMIRTLGVTRETAVRLGRVLIDRGVIHHVLDEHSFEDEGLFYRFYADESGGHRR